MPGAEEEVGVSRLKGQFGAIVIGLMAIVAFGVVTWALITNDHSGAEAKAVVKQSGIVEPNQSIGLPSNVSATLRWTIR